MYKIACVEDSLNEYEALSSALQRYGKEADLDLRLFHYPSAERFLSAFACNYDIIFLDIALPEMSGMELASAIRRTDAEVAIIFVTSLAHFALKGYEVGAFDFIVKPVIYEDFAFKMKRLMKRLKENPNTKVVISSSSKQIVIPSNEIYYVEIIGHTIIYHTSNGDIETYDTLRNVEANLSDYGFAKCNSCYLVNLAFVEGVEGYDLTIAGKKLAISHPRKKEFMHTLHAYFGNRTH